MKNRTLLVALSLSCLAFLVACTPQSETGATEPDAEVHTAAPVDARPGIDEGNARFMEAVTNADVQTMASLYTINGRLLPPDGHLIEGREAIAASWEANFAGGLSAALLETVISETHGDTAIEEGRFTMRDSDGSVLDQGKYIVIWKNEGGTWKLHQDIWNSSPVS